MIWLSVTLITITITSAIRVPTSWSNQGYVQNGLFSEVPFQNEYRTRIPNVHAFNLNYVRTPSVFNSPYTMKIPSNIAVNSRKASNNSRYDDLQNPLVSNNRVPTINQSNKHKYMNENRIVKDPNNNQETPKEIPTKVNYPGMGKWAIRGIKHKPYLHTPEYAKTKSENKKPEGYDIFERARPTFDRQKQKLVNNFLPHRKTKRVNYNTEDSPKDDNKSDFVPSQLLSQVRRVDTEEHLPPEEDEPRLREAIKDSKVHIMYTEEGYEDIGYDHAGEERNAEENEGHSIRGSGPAKPLKPVPVPVNILREFENYEDVTKEDLGTYRSKPPPLYEKNVRKHPPSTQDEHFKRHKRFVNDIPNVQIEDYLVETDGSTTPPVKQKRKKYPYYSLETLKHSPLRYAEEIRNIPKKIEGELSFYDHSGASNCPEIPLDVNPIPDKVEREKPANQSDPRLQKLGDKIACLKSKYFGENPLDNPLFLESEVEEPKSNFEEFVRTLSHKKRRKRNAQLLDDTSQATAVKENKLDEPLPEQAALTVRIVRRKFRLPSPSRIRYGSSNYLTTAPPFFSSRSTVLPKYKTISEVYYKDEIQPNEQLNVFSDVMNNIKKTRVDLVSAGSEIVENKTPPEPEGQKSRIKIKVPQKKIKIRQTSTTPHWTSSTSTTTEQVYSLPPRKNKYKSQQDVQLYEEYVNTVKHNEHTRTKKKEGELDEYGEEEVLGLSPPIPPSVAFTTPSIFEGDKANQGLLNIYPVTGMNPPTIQQPVPYYSFVNTAPLNRVRRKNQYQRIYKRSVNKLAYSEIRRKRPDPVPTDEVDDYVPQRNRNFRYDIEKQQVIYVKPTVEEDDALSQEEEEVEIPTTTPTTTTTTEMNGPSFLDYVSDLKAHSDYKVIMEPTKRTKDNEEVQSTTTPTPVITPPPAFLDIVNKLKVSEGYVAIPEKTAKTTTTVLPVDDKESEEDIDDKSQNYENINIFDISEYLPKQETDTPKTVIDYSKYKIIERRPVHNISSRYSVGDDSVPLSNTGRVVVSDSDSIDNTNVKSRERVEVSEFTTVSALLSTTKRLRLRTRRRMSVRSTTETNSSPSSTTQRNFRRRFRSTTTTYQPAATQALVESQTQRITRRRFQNREIVQKVPSNHKEVYTPIIENADIKTLPNIRSAKLIAPDVHIIKDYNHNKRHGGNYQREPPEEIDASTLSSKESERLTDVVPKPDAFYSDPNLPENVNELKESNKEDIDTNNQSSENPNKEEVKVIEERNGEKVEKDSVFIVKDPSKRLYFYAPVKR